MHALPFVHTFHQRMVTRRVGGFVRRDARCARFPCVARWVAYATTIASYPWFAMVIARTTRPVDVFAWCAWCKHATRRR